MASDSEQRKGVPLNSTSKQYWQDQLDILTKKKTQTQIEREKHLASADSEETRSLMKVVFEKQDITAAKTKSEEELAKQRIDAEQQRGAEELNEIFENVVPWALEVSSIQKLLDTNTMQAVEDVNHFLDCLYLFKVNELSVSATEDDIAADIYKRHQALITAAYQSQFTVATVIVGNGGGSVEIYLGVSGDEHVKEVFEKQIQGVYPGKGISFVKESGANRILNQKLERARHGGIITGVPTLKLDDEKQKFDITSALRSMNGQQYVLVIASRPVPKYVCSQQIIQLMELKDRCHSLANRTIGSETSMNENQSETVGTSNSDSVTTGMNGGVSPFGAFSTSTAITKSAFISTTKTGQIGIAGVGGSFGLTVGGSSAATLTVGTTLGAAITAGGMKSKTHSGSQSESKSQGWSKTTGKSLLIEEQNSMAMELELTADKLIKRLRAGLNSGIWENFITFATSNAVNARVLSGALAGELIKADPDALPVRCVNNALGDKIKLYVPTRNEFSALKANKLVSYMSSEEAALLMSPPLNSVPGFDIRRKPALSLTDSSGNTCSNAIGYISEHGRAVEGLAFSLSKDDIQKHVFVTGLTGSGKTTTVKQLLASAEDTPFLIIESAKREYRRLRKDPHFKGLKVFTIGDSLAPLRHNPFMVLPNVSLITHIDNLKSIFNASFSLYGPMPYILEKCLFNIYQHKGWNITTGKHHRIQLATFADCKAKRYIFPTIVDLKEEVHRYVKEELDYKGELQDNIRSAIVTRLESLAVGSKGFIFNTHEFLDFEELLKGKVVLELESLADDDDKAFFVGLILTFVSEYRQSLSRRSVLDQTAGLKHIMVIEEAHRLLKNVSTERTSEMMGNPKGKAVEAFCNIIAEMRSLGQGVIVAEQIPTKIAPDVIKNTNTKIAHRLVSYDDQCAMGAGMGLDEDECRYYNQLTAGFSLAHKEGMSKPVELQVFNSLPNSPVGDIAFVDEGKEQFFNMYHQNLDTALALHESGLLWSKNAQKTSLRTMNSIFLSGCELQELLPEAVAEIRKHSGFRYSVDKIIVEEALKHWLYRTLFSQTIDLGRGKQVTQEIATAYERLWTDSAKFNRSRFINAINKWSENDSCLQVKEFAVGSIALESELNREVALSMLTLRNEENVRVEVAAALLQRLG